MLRFIRRVVEIVDGVASTPGAALLAIAAAVLWCAVGPAMRFSASWQLFMTTGSSLVTLVMVFVIASTQKRDGAALQLKIDMLLAVHPDLSNDLVGLERKDDHHLESTRRHLAAIVDSEELASTP